MSKQYSFSQVRIGIVSELSEVQPEISGYTGCCSGPVSIESPEHDCIRAGSRVTKIALDNHNVHGSSLVVFEEHK